MTRERLRSIALWLALAGALGSALEADGGKAKNVILEGRVAAQTGTGSIRFSIDTSPIIFYLTTVNGKYHALLLRVKNDTGAPLALSKDQDSIALTFADGQHVQGLLNLPPVDRATWDGLETENPHGDRVSRPRTRARGRGNLRVRARCRHKDTPPAPRDADVAHVHDQESAAPGRSASARCGQGLAFR